jgi:8-oxo-dGTP pyrophosphatase MutT (NUDIX family)
MGVAEPPLGAAVLVSRRRPDGEREWLILHRAHNGAAHEGDWAWTPPSGLRLPGEDPAECARRELHEEAGLELDVQPLGVGAAEWAVFAAEAPPDAVVSLDFEHDRYEWVTLDEAERRCLPASVGTAFRALAQ